MNTSSYSDKLDAIVNMAKTKYKDFTIDYSPVDFGNGQVHVFFFKAEKEEVLFKNWENINSWIAGNFQTELKSEFETWNLYLLFIVPKKISPELKYKIENDPFSSRKIVIEEFLDHYKIIEEFITNKNLELDKDEIEKPRSKNLELDFDLQKLLKGKVLKEKKNKQEASVVFDELVKLLKSRENEV